MPAVPCYEEVASVNRRQGQVKGVTGRIYRHDMSRDVRLDNIDHRRCDLQELQAFDELQTVGPAR